MFLFRLVFAMSLCASVYMCFVVTCWERADLLALVCGVYCESITFPLVSWVRCGTWLYRFLIFAPLLTLTISTFCYTVERIERNIDGKLLSIIERTTVYIWFSWNSSGWMMAVDQRSYNRILLIVGVKMSLKNIFPYEYYIFFVAARLVAKYI